MAHIGGQSARRRQRRVSGVRSLGSVAAAAAGTVIAAAAGGAAVSPVPRRTVWDACVSVQPSPAFSATLTPVHQLLAGLFLRPCHCLRCGVISCPQHANPVSFTVWLRTCGRLSAAVCRVFTRSVSVLSPFQLNDRLWRASPHHVRNLPVFARLRALHTFACSRNQGPNIVYSLQLLVSTVLHEHSTGVFVRLFVFYTRYVGMYV